MRRILLTGVAALALTAAPAMLVAQSPAGETGTDATATDQGVPGSTNSVDDKRPHMMTTEQQTMYDAWPPERRADYDAWPSEYQVYYWGLEPEFQTGYWALTAEQREQMQRMSEEQQAAAWTSIMAQLDGASADAMASSSAATTATDLASDTAMPATQTAAATKEYPLCRGAVQDNCINPREAGMNWGNRPLDYWPGEPASQMGG